MMETSNLKLQNSKQIIDHKSQNLSYKYDLRERLLTYSKRILMICKMLPKISECEEIRRQLVAVGTSVGANFEEADGALTKKDFINKTGISRKEAKESKYWLRLISGIYIEEN